MPALPVTHKDQAWQYWQAGLISAANVGIGVNGGSGFPILANLAVRKGYNAIRIQLNHDDSWGLSSEDLFTIATQGWDTTALSTASRPAGGAPRTIQDIAQQLDRILALAAQLRIGVILTVSDFHQESGGSLWQQASQQDALVGFWQATARRWPDASHPEIIGYDLLSRPCPDPSLSFAELNALPPQQPTLHNWRALAQRCLIAIRQRDLHTPIVVQGVYGGAARGLDVFRNLDNPADRSLLISDPAGRVVYGFNLYAPKPFTEQGATPSNYEAIGTLYGDAAYAHWRNWDHYNASAANNRAPVNLSQDFSSYLSLISHYRNDAFYQNQGRSNPLPDFHKQFGVPGFVAEFGAVNPRLTRSSDVSADSPHRTITGLTIESRQVTVTLGLLDGQGFRIDCGAAARNWPFSHTVLAQISETGTPLDGQTYTVQLTAGQRSFTFTSSAALPNLALGGSQQSRVGTLTLALLPNKQGPHDLARQRYARDVLRMCRQLGLSWAWQFEDSDAAAEFKGWRASSSVNAALTSAANGLTLN